MAEALAILGGIAASIQLVQIARKALRHTKLFPGQKSPEQKLEEWLFYSVTFSLIVDELEKINHSAIATRLVQRCRKEVDGLAVHLWPFTRKSSTIRYSPSWFVRFHERQVEAVFTSLRKDFEL